MVAKVLVALIPNNKKRAPTKVRAYFLPWKEDRKPWQTQFLQN